MSETLSAVKRELLAKLLSGQGAGSAPTVRIPPAPAGTPVRLSYAQERVWLTSQLAGDVPAFNLGGATRMPVRVDVAGLRARFDDVVRRHDALRTCVELVDGHPTLRVADSVPVDITVTEVPDDGLEAAVERIVVAPYELEKAPLWRLEILRPAHGGDVVVFGVHHLIADGESVTYVLRELAEPGFRPDLPVTYADYAAWQRTEHANGAYAGQEAFWRETLADLPPPLELPADRPRPPNPDYLGGTVRLPMPDGLGEKLRELGKTEDTTLFTVTLAALTALLSRYTGQTDVIVGCQASGRNLPELNHLAGMFVNLVPVRTSVAGDLTFRDLVRRVRASSTAAFAHRDVRFEELVRLLRGVTPAGPPPLVQVACNLPLSTTSRPPGEEIPLPISPGGALLDLTVHLVTRGGGGLELQLDYPTAMFDRSTVERMAAGFRRLLESVALAPETPLAALDLLDAEERRTLLYAGAGPTSDAPDHLLDLIAARVAATPDAVAAEAGDRRLTYADLAAAAAAGAARLRALGAGPGRVVAFCLDRDITLPVAALAIWQTGAAFLPLDPDHPPARWEELLRETSAVAVVTDRAAAFAGRAVVDVEELQVTGVEPDFAAVEPGDAAYVMFTSGSTGRPKGAVVTHAAIANRVCWSVAVQGLGPGDRLLAKTRIGFDAAVLEWFAPLASGATVVLAPAGVERDPAALVAAVADSRATILQGVPSVFRAMLGEPGWERCGTLRQIWSAGEPLDAPLVRGLRERVAATLWNTYGPTECAIDVTAHRVPADDPSGRVPIGRPIAGVRALVLDAGHRLVPRGVSGELFIGGVAVGAGYLGRPDLTAERFVPDPYGPSGGRLYRTGDRARWRGDSLLEFVGRVDDQIKINGVRVEPAEAQAALAANPDVREAVVVGAKSPDGRYRLVGYVVAVGPLDVAVLRDDLATRVPAALIPAVFVQLDSLPRNANGKIDRAALPVPDLTTGSRPPSTMDELAVAAVWADLLDVTDIGVDDDFFALGGHSLMLGQLALRLRERTGVEVSIRDLFGGLTVRRQAALLAVGTDDDAVVPVPRPGAVPLSPGQRRLWFLDRLNPGGLEYLTPVFRTLSGPVDTARVQAALNDVVARHEALRTRYVVEGEEPVQVVDPPAPVPLVEVSTVDDFGAEMARGFDLATGPLLRGVFARADGVLLILMHHIACDGWSTGIIATEFDERYAGAALPVEPAPLQYGDFAVWQNGRLGTDAVARQRAYWRTALGGLPTLDLPIDRPRPAVRDARGGVVAFEVPADLAGAVIAAGRGRGASASMTLLAVFALLLSKYTGQRDVPVGVPVAGRPRPELDGVVGLFINTLVVRCDLDGDPTLADLVDRVRGTVLAAHAHAEVPFDVVVDDLAPERDLSRNPLYDVLFDLHEPGYSGYLPVTEFEETGTGSRQDLALVVQRRADGSLAAMLEYATSLFDRPTAQRIAHHYRALLERFAADPTARATDVDLLTAAELDALRRGWAATDVPLEPATLTDLLVRQAERTPDAEAVVFDGVALTYAELHARATRLAGRLVELGAGPESVVGVALPRSLDLVVALVAVLRAGAAYLPLDPDHPPARNRALLADASPALVIGPDDDLGTGAAVPRPADPANPAYVIYTSGSTGAPKGVVVPHAGIVNRLRWTQDRYRLTAADRVLQKTPAGFDVSVWEFFWPLATGATLVLAEPGGHRDPGYLAELIRTERITTVHFVPSMVDTFLADPAAATCTGLRRVLCSGEALPVATRDRFHRTLPGVELHNLYGPTEASVDVTAWECRPGEPTVPIGHPVWNTRTYVLDRDLRPLPPGVPGELYLAGAQLARGDLGRPGLTAARFGPDPHGPPGTRMYRTGDRAALRPDGAVEYLGRTDFQVKIRGHRVEPGEVAAALATHPGVREAVVTAVTSAGSGAGDTYLVAYWCPSGEGGGPDLADHCAQVLPAAMVPRYFVTLDRLPLTPNGKIDRAALPAPEPVASGADHVAPRTVAEERIAEIWAELLVRPLDSVGVHDHFFRTGGHSLLAVRLSTRLTEEFDVELPLLVVFEQPTIAEQAHAVEAAIRAEIDELTDDEVAHLAVQGRT